MNRTFTHLLALAFVMVTAFSACTKNSDVLSITKENLAGSYTIISVTAKAPGVAVQDVTSDNYEPCELDDQVVLNSDLTATYIDAGTQCTPAGGGSDYWSVNGNVITISGDDFTVKSLTKTALVVEQTTNVSGLVVTVTWTYRRY